MHTFLGFKLARVFNLEMLWFDEMLGLGQTCLWNYSFMVYCVLKSVFELVGVLIEMNCWCILAVLRIGNDFWFQSCYSFLMIAWFCWHLCWKLKLSWESSNPPQLGLVWYIDFIIVQAVTFTPTRPPPGFENVSLDHVDLLLWYLMVFVFRWNLTRQGCCNWAELAELWGKGRERARDTE